MAEPSRSLLLLAGRLDTPGELGEILALLDRLGRAGVAGSLLCVSGGDGAAGDERVVECPGLGHRWQQALAVRRLHLGEGLRRPDLIHVLHLSKSGVGLALAEHWRMPYVQTVDEFLGPRDRLRISRRWCRRLVAVRQELAHDLEVHYGVPAELLCVIHPGVTIADDLAQALGPHAARVPVIGTAGPLIPAAGFATFLNAARRVLDAGIDAEFVIAGDGEDEVDLRRRADRLRIADRVTFASQSLEAFRYWNVLDIFCQTSLVPTVGRSLLMAMATGVPSIVSDVGGLRMLIEHESTGLRVPPDNSAALAESILALLKEPERAHELGRRGQEVVRRQFHPDDEVRSLAALYDEILEPEASARPVTLPLRAG
jgi:glycosyltransferase involved in cell wall biosynthesis